MNEGSATLSQMSHSASATLSRIRLNLRGATPSIDAFKKKTNDAKEKRRERQRQKKERQKDRETKKEHLQNSPEKIILSNSRPCIPAAFHFHLFRI